MNYETYLMTNVALQLATPSELKNRGGNRTLAGPWFSSFEHHQSRIEWVEWNVSLERLIRETLREAIKLEERPHNVCVYVWEKFISFNNIISTLWRPHGQTRVEPISFWWQVKRSKHWIPSVTNIGCKCVWPGQTIDHLINIRPGGNENRKSLDEEISWKPLAVSWIEISFTQKHRIFQQWPQTALRLSFYQEIILIGFPRRSRKCLD